MFFLFFSRSSARVNIYFTLIIMPYLTKSKGFLQEFKDFALKGNVIDLAVAVVIGAAFNKIVSVFVASIITPLLGYFTSGVNLALLTLKLGAVELKYGELLQAGIDFIIIALSVFVAIKALSVMQRKKEATPAEPAPKPDEVVLLEQIRDLLQKQSEHQ